MAKKMIRMVMKAAAMNSIDTRCGQASTVSSGSLSTRVTPSWRTSASSRYRFSTPY
jgi:hypothetical protein